MHVNDVYDSHVGWRRRREGIFAKKQWNPPKLLFALPCETRVNKTDGALALMGLPFLFWGWGWMEKIINTEFNKIFSDSGQGDVVKYDCLKCSVSILSFFLSSLGLILFPC